MIARNSPMANRARTFSKDPMVGERVRVNSIKLRLPIFFFQSARAKAEWESSGKRGLMEFHFAAGSDLCTRASALLNFRCAHEFLWYFSARWIFIGRNNYHTHTHTHKYTCTFIERERAQGFTWKWIAFSSGFPGSAVLSHHFWRRFFFSINSTFVSLCAITQDCTLKKHVHLSPTPQNRLSYTVKLSNLLNLVGDEIFESIYFCSVPPPPLDPIALTSTE